MIAQLDRQAGIVAHMFYVRWVGEHALESS
jgi:hypothetical protein